MATAKMTRTAVTAKAGKAARPANLTKAAQAAKATKAAPAAVTKRFRVLLKKHAASEAALFTVPFDVTKVFGARGQVPVRITVNGFPFRGTIFPVGDGTHYMVVNREVRAGARVKGGDTVTITMERDDEPRTVTPPPDLARALAANRAAQEAWDRLSYTHKKEHARSVEEAKRPETRARRVEKAVEQLAATAGERD